MKRFKFITFLIFTLLFIGGFKVFAYDLPSFFVVSNFESDCASFGSCAVYVNDKSNSSSNPEGTKTDWFESITDAVNKVKEDSSFNTIIIAEGRYSFNGTPESMPFVFNEDDEWSISKNVFIYGGYSEDFTDRNPYEYKTIIDGNDSVGSAFQIENLGGEISGIEFVNFKGKESNLVEVKNISSTAYDFVVGVNNFKDNDFLNSSNVLKFELFGNNKGEVLHNEFLSNETEGSSSLLSLVGDVKFHSNLVRGNTSDVVILCNGSTVYNNFLIKNNSDNVLNAQKKCSFYNNTLVGNEINSGVGKAVLFMSGSSNKIANNLITYTNGNRSFLHHGGDSSVFEYNGFFENYDDEDIESLGNGNLVCDPHFLTNDFYSPDKLILGETSECIDNGKVVSVVTEDYFGSERPMDGDGVGGAQYDIGAFELFDYFSDTEPVVGLQISGLTVSPAVFSPNDDGEKDVTTISFNLNDNADVSVIVLNSSNVELNKLMNVEPKSAGSHLLTWSGKNSLKQVVEDGTYFIKVTASNATENDTKTVDVIVDTEPDIQCGGYVDVLSAHPSCEAIKYMQSIGAMTGNPDGTFSPDEFLQRDQVVKIVLETFNLFDENEDYCKSINPFPDVTFADWSYQYICKGLSLKMITGYQSNEDSGLFKPARAVNRVEFLALTLRNLSEDEGIPSVLDVSYDDTGSGNWYNGFTKYSLDKSLFVGPKLFPGQSVKRSEVADVIYKLHVLGKI